MKSIYHKMFLVLATIIALLFIGASSASAQGTYGCQLASTPAGALLCIPNPADVACTAGFQPGAGCNTADQASCDSITFSCETAPTAAPPVIPGTAPRTISIYGSCGAKTINTAIGCVPVGDSNSLIAFFITWSIGIAGGIAFLLIVVAGFIITTSRGDPTRLKAGQELLTSAISGVILLVFSIVILRIVGVGILGLPIAK